jgi:hypothetical protein
MTDDNDLGMENPGQYGIQDPSAPGEPDYWGHDVSQPVPGTAKQTRNEQEGTRSGYKQGEGSGSSGGGGRDSH